MTAMELLKRRRRLELELRMESERIQQAREDIISLRAVDYSKDKIQNSKHTDLSDVIAKLEAYQQKKEEKLQELLQFIVVFDKVVDEIKDPILKALIYHRYERARSWKEVAIAINNSEANAKLRLHTRAVQAVERIIEKM